VNLPPSDVFYQPCTPLDIVARVLRHLIPAYDQPGEAPKRNDVETRLAAPEA